jgi:hypothetical protein
MTNRVKRNPALDGADIAFLLWLSWLRRLKLDPEQLRVLKGQSGILTSKFFMKGGGRVFG